MTKIELVSELFLDFNRDPYKNKPLVEHYVKRLQDCDITLLNRSITELSNEKDTLPRCKEILAKYSSFEYKEDRYENSEYCDSCGNTGVVMGVFCGKDMIYSLNYIPEGEYYYTSVIGRCSCEARKNWSPNWTITEPSKMLRLYSKQNEMDCSSGANFLVIELNQRKHKCKEKVENNTSQLTQESKEGLPF
tara:strand:+ start:4028 stop:4600 length:573 start_codon:yes stop_codon:yes gene_type:complete